MHVIGDAGEKNNQAANGERSKHNPRIRIPQAGVEGMHQEQCKRGGGHHGDAAEAGYRLRMNLPAVRGVYQSKRGRPPSNHRGKDERQRGATEAK
jgi:hypothetical protein